MYVCVHIIYWLSIKMPLTLLQVVYVLFCMLNVLCLHLNVGSSHWIARFFFVCVFIGLHLIFCSENIYNLGFHLIVYYKLIQFCSRTNYPLFLSVFLELIV